MIEGRGFPPAVVEGAGISKCSCCSSHLQEAVNDHVGDQAKLSHNIGSAASRASVKGENDGKCGNQLKSNSER